MVSGRSTPSTIAYRCAHPAVVCCLPICFLPLFCSRGHAGCTSGFAVRSVGNCDGHNFIETEAQCSAASAAWSLPDPTPSIATSGTEVPHGCYWKQTSPDGSNRLRSRRAHNSVKLWFNPNGNQNDDDTTRVSLCRELTIAVAGPSRLLPTKLLQL